MMVSLGCRFCFLSFFFVHAGKLNLPTTSTQEKFKFMLAFCSGPKSKSNKKNCSVNVSFIRWRIVFLQRVIQVKRLALNFFSVVLYLMILFLCIAVCYLYASSTASNAISQKDTFIHMYICIHKHIYNIFRLYFCHSASFSNMKMKKKEVWEETTKAKAKIEDEPYVKYIREYPFWVFRQNEKAMISPKVFLCLKIFVDYGCRCILCAVRLPSHCQQTNAPFPFFGWRDEWFK